MALYRKFDFAIEGMCRAYAFRDGRYVDAYLMARLHPAFQASEVQENADSGMMSERRNTTGKRQ